MGIKFGALGDIGLGALGDVGKVLPEIMTMSQSTQENLIAIRELLERLVEIHEFEQAETRVK